MYRLFSSTCSTISKTINKFIVNVDCVHFPLSCLVIVWCSIPLVSIESSILLDRYAVPFSNRANSIDLRFFFLAKEIGYYNTVSSIIWSIGSVVGVKIFSYTRWSDAMICCVSHICFIISALWTSQALYNWQLYIGLLISPFTSYQGQLTYSIISKWLEPDEINNAYTFVTEVNTILTVFGNSVFNYLYSITVSYSRNFTLFLAASLGIIPFILNVILYVVTKNIPDDLDARVTERKPILIPDHMPLTAPAGTENVLLPARTGNNIRRNRRV